MSFLALDDLPYLSLAGFTLNTEEKAAIASSLEVKQDQEKLDDIWLWGKILGVQRDYLIAQAVADNVFARKFYYSIDLVNWLLLPEITSTDVQLINRIQGRFTGDPSYEYTITNAGEESAEEMTMNEEKRLSATVTLINYEAEIVPRGAYYRDALHQLQRNKSFSGISKGELAQLSNYLHFREGFDINKKTLMERANNFDESIDIFDSISRDNPRGVWSCQTERTGTVAILRNHHWPGYTFFHTSNPTKWGSMYYGTGQRNLNIGFML